MPIYVGQTSKSIVQRFNDHCDERAFTSTRWGKHHFLPDFSRAFDRSIRVRRKEYGKEFGVALDRLNRKEAEYHEKCFAYWLRKQGYATYWA